jgi:hypothetical protein
MIFLLKIIIESSFILHIAPAPEIQSFLWPPEPFLSSFPPVSWSSFLRWENCYVQLSYYFFNFSPFWSSTFVGAKLHIWMTWVILKTLMKLVSFIYIFNFSLFGTKVIVLYLIFFICLVTSSSVNYKAAISDMK